MPSIIQPLITNAGLAAAQAQSGLGLQLGITHIQLGTGTYTLNPAAGSSDYNRTALVTPTETVAISAGHVMDKAFRVDAQFPAWSAAPYSVSEIGFWAGNPAAGGVLFAIWGQPTAITQRSNIDYLASFAVALARVPSGSISVSFDASLSHALQVVSFHEQAANPHPQYRPTGTIVWVSGTASPAGTIKANGALLNRADFPELWTYAQGSGNLAPSDGSWTPGKFSPGNGSTTFRIPDWRGYSPRAWDDGRGIDMGRAIGTVQADQLLQHAHTVTDGGHAHGVSISDPGHSHVVYSGAGSNSLAYPVQDGDGNNPSYSQATTVSATGISIGVQSASSNISIQNSSGGTEVRVKNISALACIIY